MKKFTTLLLLAASALFHTASGYEDGKCMMAVTYSEMAYLTFKKATKATSTAASGQAIKKGIEQAQQAAAYAVQCSCTNAETYTLTAYTIGKKGLDRTELKDMQAAAKKAMDLCLDAMSAAQQCNK